MQENKTKEIHDLAREVGYDVDRSGLSFEKFTNALFRAYDKGYEAGFFDQADLTREAIYEEYTRLRSQDEE